EASNKIVCANNMKQLGIACHAYAEANGSLPAACLIPYFDAPLPGGLDATGIAGRHEQNAGHDAFPFGPNWAVLLLPYTERNDLYASLQQNPYPGPGDQTGPIDPNNPQHYYKYSLKWRDVRTTALPFFVCPTDTGHEVPFTPDA